MSKKSLGRHAVSENLIYLIFWLVIMLFPLVSEYMRQSDPFPWNEIFLSWLISSLILVIFLINNFVLLPFFFLKKRYILYAVSLLSLIILTSAVNPFTIINGKGLSPAPPHRNERMYDRPSDHREAPGRPEDFQQAPPRDQAAVPPIPPKGGMGNGPKRGGPAPLALILPIKAAPFFNHFFIALLIICFNIAIKLVFKTYRDEKQMKELEKEKLESELDYLKYQINPHFFMNTLNNIHALIDIDPEKGKESVIQLSKIMRYVLYDTTDKFISVSKAASFLENYVELMKIRYMDSVDIKFTIQEDLPKATIPPLLFASFVENAFKFGISYDQPSFVHIGIRYLLPTGMLLLQVSNSVHKENGPATMYPDSNTGGIGMENARKRLDLLYGTDYSLTIEDLPDSYSVSLLIPANVA